MMPNKCCCVPIGHSETEKRRKKIDPFVSLQATMPATAHPVKLP